MQVLLVRRRFEPYESYWALPGGALEAGETLEQAAERELREETGVTDAFTEQLATFSELDRDPRGRVISCCYLALVDAARVTLRPGSDSREAVWRRLDPLPRPEPAPVTTAVPLRIPFIRETPPPPAPPHRASRESACDRRAGA